MLVEKTLGAARAPQHQSPVARHESRQKRRGGGMRSGALLLGGIAHVSAVAFTALTGAALLGAAPALAQATADGTTVPLTAGTATCNPPAGTTCFEALNGGTIDSAGNPVAATVSTLGNSATYGAYAHSGGTINLNDGGSISAANVGSTSRAAGLYASGGTIAGTGLTVSASNTGGTGALGVLADAGGQVTLTNSSVSTAGFGFSYGLFATGMGSSITLENTIVTATAVGNYAAVVDSGSSITVTGGSIAGNGGAAGVQVSGTFTGSNTTITVSGDSTSSVQVIGGTATLNGTSVVNNGAGSRAVQLFDGSTFTMTGGSVTTTQDTARAVSLGAATASFTGVTIETSGASAPGIAAGSGANVSFTNSAMTLHGAGAFGLYAGGSGTPIAFDVSGSTIATPNGTAIAALGTSSNINISNGSTVTGGSGGLMLVAHLTATSNPGVVNLTADNSTLIGDTTVDGAAANTANIVLQNNATLTGDINVDTTNGAFADLAVQSGASFTGATQDVRNLTTTGGTWNVTGDSTLTGTLTNGGSIAFAAAGPFKTIITPNYVGNGGAMSFNTALGDDSSSTDQLIINGGTASGNTNVTVANKGGAGALTTGAGIPIITTAGGGTTAAGAFVLAGTVAAGPFQYLLFQGGNGGDPNDWYLRSHFDEPGPPGPTPFYRPETSIYGSLPGLARTLGVTTIGTFHERYGDQGAVRGAGGRAWGRVFGEHSEQGSSGELDTRFDGWLGGVQLGIDAFRIRGDGGAQDAGGFFFALARADGDVNGHAIGVPNAYAGDSALNGPSFGAYYTHIGPSNWYVDSVAMVTFYNADGTSTNNVATNSGGSGAFLSLEGGVPIVLGYGATLEGQGQLIYQHLDFGGTTDPFSTVGFDTPDALTGRLGLRLATFEGSAYRPYLKANIWQDWSGTDRTIYANTHVLSSKDNSTALEVGGGVVGDVTQTVSWWGVVDYTTDVGGNDLEVVRGNLGVKVGW